MKFQILYGYYEKYQTKSNNTTPQTLISPTTKTKMITIKNINLKGAYRILWLRYITGVDLSNHCMKSLRGQNDPRVRGYNYFFENLELPKARYYYFCGVDEGFRWERNIHIAFVECEGIEIYIDNQFVTAHIVNAKQIQITERHIDYSLPQSRNIRFNTCRNWWFANQIAKEFNQPK